MKQDFIYHGPVASFAFTGTDGACLWEGTAIPGKTLSGLPDDHPHVAALVAAGHLSRAPAGGDVAQHDLDAGPKRSSPKKGKEE